MRYISSRFKIRPNRFRGVSVIRVFELYPVQSIGCLVNMGLVLALLVFGAAIWLFAGSAGSASSAAARPTVDFPPTPTEFPTSTPHPTPTEFPTSTPHPTPIPYRPKSFQEIESNPGLVSDVTCEDEYSYCYYEAFCLPGPNRIEPRVAGLSALSGLHFKLWNDYGWQAEREFTIDTTFQLSDDPSVFHLALFYYQQQVSQQVDIDYPGDCQALQVVYVQRAPSPANNVSASGVGVKE